jgi:Glycosyl hydrolase-like 10
LIFGGFMAGKLTGYWVTYSGDLKGKTIDQIQEVFSSILQRPYIKKVYIDVLAAAGRTYNSSSSSILNNFANVLPIDPATRNPIDIFTIFNNVRASLSRYDVQMVAWIEASSYTFSTSTFATNAKNSSSVISLNTDLNGVLHLDLLKQEVYGVTKQAALDLANRQEIWGVAVDDHFGLLNSVKRADGSIIDLRAAMIARYKTATSQYPLGADQWFTDQITAKLKDLSSSVRANGTKFIVSTNPFLWAKQNTHQDPASWYQDIVVDEMNVQIYRSTVNDFNSELSKLKSTVDNLNAYKTPMSISLVVYPSGVCITLPDTVLTGQLNTVSATTLNGLPIDAVGFNYIDWRGVNF